MGLLRVQMGIKVGKQEKRTRQPGPGHDGGADQILALGWTLFLQCTNALTGHRNWKNSKIDKIVPVRTSYSEQRTNE